ncbi:MAG: hypothetical protein V7L22_03875 [Nostoc sp.]|nr:hypothetical protein [Nostoc sp. C052]
MPIRLASLNVGDESMWFFGASVNWGLCLIASPILFFEGGYLV